MPALDACAGMGVNVEMKADCPPAVPPTTSVSATVATRSVPGPSPSRFLVTSFSWDLVDRVRPAGGPIVATGLLAFDLRTGPDPVAAAVAGGHRGA